MVPIDVEALRAQVQAMDYLRGTPDEVALWREDMAESRANLAIEDMILSGRRERYVRDDAGRGPAPFADAVSHPPSLWEGCYRSRSGCGALMRPGNISSWIASTTAATPFSLLRTLPGSNTRPRSS